MVLRSNANNLNLEEVIATKFSEESSVCLRETPKRSSTAIFIGDVIKLLCSLPITPNIHYPQVLQLLGNQFMRKSGSQSDIMVCFVKKSTLRRETKDANLIFGVKPCLIIFDP